MASSMLQRRGLASRPPAASRAGRSSRGAAVVAQSGSHYGTLFRVSTFGESHGKGVGCIVDGVPPRLEITEEEIQAELDRRKPGQSIITTPRKEDDTCEILSGVVDNVTMGSPIAVLVRNKNQRSQDYKEMSTAYRPSHADATYDFKVICKQRAARGGDARIFFTSASFVTRCAAAMRQASRETGRWARAMTRGNRLGMKKAEGGDGGAMPPGHHTHRPNVSVPSQACGGHLAPSASTRSPSSLT
eukprot:352473-Chlamydomonas_euryale.AAC.10